MPQALARIATTALLALAAAWGNAQTGDWGDVTIISSTAGNNPNRLCMGVPDHMRPADIGCPSYAPSLSTAGHVSITGNVSANKFIGDGSGLTNLNVQGDRIISNTHAAVVNENSGYISLTTSGGTWGYFSAGWSLLANLFTNTVSSSLVSATNVSATYVDTTRNGTVSGTYGYFRYISGTDIYGRFTGDGTGLTGVTAAASDRIISGTNAATRMVAISDTGYISITQAGANSGWFDPYRGLITLGVSATGPISGTNGYFSGGVGIGHNQPAYLLDISGSNAGIRISRAGSDPFVYFVNAETGQGLGQLRGVSTGGLKFTGQTVGNEWARFDASGRLAVGMQSPTATLQVSGSFIVSTTGQGGNASLFVNDAGQVAIGSTNPQAALTVSGTTSFHPFAVNGSFPSITLQGDAAYQGVANVLRFRQGNTTAGSIAFTFFDGAYTPLALRRYGGSDSRVGIGTLSPTATLEVVGTISATNAIQVGTSTLTCGGGIPGAMRYQGTSLQYCNGTTWTTLGASGGGQEDRIVSGTTNAIAWQDRSLTITTSNVQRMIVGENGRVGIGTHLPTAPLEISDTVAKIKLNDTSGIFGGGLVLMNSSVTNWTLGGGNDGVDQTSFGFLDASNNLVLNMKQGGTVGIGGVVTPTATLQVSGTFTVSTSAQTTTPSLYVGIDGKIGAGISTPRAGFNLYGSGQNTANINTTGDMGNMVLAQGSGIAGGEGGGIVFGNRTVGGANDGLFAAIKSLLESGSNNSAGSLAFSTRTVNTASTLTEKVRISAAGNVGISNAIPLAKLDVNGTISASDAIQLGQNTIACASGVSGSIRYNTTSNTVQFCNGSVWTSLASGTTSGSALGDRIVSGTTNAIAWQDRSLTITTANTQRMIVGEDGNIGIGTSTPNALLDLAGPSGPSNSGPAVKISATTTNTNLSLFFRSPESRGSVNLGRSGLGQKGNALNVEASGDINFYAGGANQGAESMVVDETGNVGIRTISPTATLQVSGTFTVSMTGQGEPSLLVDGDGRVGVRANQARQSLLTVGPNTLVAAPASSLMVKESSGTIGNAANSYVYPAELQYQTSGGNTARLLMSGYRRDAGTLWTGTGYRLQYGVDNSFMAGERAYIELGSALNGDGRIIFGLHSADRLIITTNTIVASGTVSVTDAIQVGSSTLSCSSGIPGAIRYNSPNLQFCNGTSWTNIGGGGTVTGTGSATSVAFWNGPSSLSYDTDGFYWDATNNRLGIGTNTPSVTLNLVANQLGAGTMRAMNLNTQGYAGITLANHSNESVGTFTYGNANAFLFPNAVWIGTRSNTVPLVFTANGSDAEDMRLSNGRLGIGTPSATATLQVSGSFTVSTTGQDATPTMYVTAGRVGIGTNNPQERLHVGNDTGGRMFIGQDDASARRGLLIAASTANEVSGSTYPPFVRLAAHDYGSARSMPLVINPHGTQGFVSIGKFDPKAMLDVQGTISASDAIQIGQSNLLCSSPISGSIRYNTTSDTLQVCTGSGWRSLVSGTTGGGGGGVTGTGSATAVAFWSSSNALTFDSGLYWDNVNKRLGVGTVTPLRGLEVRQGSDDVLSGFGVANAAANSRISLWVNNGTGHLWSGGSGQSPLVLNAGGGFVGIGTEYPAAMLAVSGTISATNAIQVGQSNLLCSSPISGSIRYNTTSNTIQFCNGVGWVSLASGTTGGGGTLTGTGSATAVAFWSGSNVLTYSGGFYWDNANKRLGIGTNTPAQALWVSVTTADALPTFENTSANGRMLVRSMSNAGNITLRAYGSAYSETLFDNPMARTMSLVGVTSNSAPMIIGSYFDGPLVFGVSNSEDMRITAIGNVGIGTKSPTSALQVSGTFTVSTSAQTTTPSLYVGVDGKVGVGTSAPAGRMEIVQDVGGENVLTLKQASDGVNAARFELRKSRGTPVAPAAVQANDLIGNIIAGGYDGTEFNSYGAAQISFYAEKAFDASTRDTSIRFQTAQGATVYERMRIMPNGNVGIGTLQPSATLTVSGTISATNAIQLGQNTIACANGVSGSIRYNTTSNTVQFCNGTGWVSLSSGTTGGGNPVGDRIVSGTTNAIASENQSLTISTAGSPRMLVGADGKVGIGTITPTVGLDVFGHFAARTETGALAIQTVGSGNGRVLLGGATVDNLATVQIQYTGNNNSGIALSVANSSSVPLFRVVHNGNVGIGNITPTAKLEVAGTISATDAIQVGTSSLACSGGIQGAIRYNAGSLQLCNGTFWGTLGGGAADRITNGTVSVTVNANGFVSLTTGVTDWGYLSSGETYLPNLRSNSVSATLVSATIIHTTGNVGIGTTSPSAKLDVTSRQDLDNVKALVLSNASTNWTSVSKSVSLVFTRTPAGNIETHDYGEIRGGIESGDGAQGYLSFWSGGGGNRSEKMRIMHNGRVGIGTTAPSTTLYVNGGQIAGGFGAMATTGVLDFNDVSNARSGNGYTLLRGSTAANAPNTSTNYWQTLNFEYGASKLGDGNITQLAVPYSAGASIAEGMYMRGRGSGTWTGWYKFIMSDPSGSAVVANSLTAAAFLYSSDKRLKENIAPLTGGLAKLESITPVKFRFVSDTMHSIRLGVIAQEVEMVYPEAVVTASDGFKKVDYPALVPVVIDAVKELNAENRKLREEVKSLKAANVLLKAANDNFDARLNALELKMAR